MALGTFVKKGCEGPHRVQLKQRGARVPRLRRQLIRSAEDIGYFCEAARLPSFSTVSAESRPAASGRGNAEADLHLR
jgi:hypothetical protein